MVKVAPGKAPGHPSLLIIFEIVRWGGSTHGEGTPPLFNLCHVFRGSFAGFPSNGNRHLALGGAAENTAERPGLLSIHDRNRVDLHQAPGVGGKADDL